MADFPLGTYVRVKNKFVREDAPSRGTIRGTVVAPPPGKDAAPGWSWVQWSNDLLLQERNFHLQEMMYRLTRDTPLVLHEDCYYRVEKRSHDLRISRYGQAEVAFEVRPIPAGFVIISLQGHFEPWAVDGTPAIKVVP